MGLGKELTTWEKLEKRVRVIEEELANSKGETTMIEYRVTYEFPIVVLAEDQDAAILKADKILLSQVEEEGENFPNSSEDIHVEVNS